MQTFIKLGPERHGSVHTTRNCAHGTHFVHATLPPPCPAQYSRVLLNLRARRRTPIEACARIFRTLLFQYLEHPGSLTYECSKTISGAFFLTVKETDIRVQFDAILHHRFANGSRL